MASELIAEVDPMPDFDGLINSLIEAGLALVVAGVILLITTHASSLSDIHRLSRGAGRALIPSARVTRYAFANSFDRVRGTSVCR